MGPICPEIPGNPGLDASELVYDFLVQSGAEASNCGHSSLRLSYGSLSLGLSGSSGALGHFPMDHADQELKEFLHGGTGPILIGPDRGLVDATDEDTRISDFCAEALAIPLLKLGSEPVCYGLSEVCLWGCRHDRCDHLAEHIASL